MIALRGQISKYSIGVHLNTKPRRIVVGGVDGREAGGKALQGRHRHLRRSARSGFPARRPPSFLRAGVYMIGDCRVPKNIAAAASAAYTVARDIGVY
jgi:hypothetical protein